jgi:hypothetical protein
MLSPSASGDEVKQVDKDKFEAEDNLSVSEPAVKKRGTGEVERDNKGKDGAKRIKTNE